MRIVFIGCTNGKDDLLAVPDGDVLICTGDFSSSFGMRYDLDRFNALLGRLPHKHKFVVFGDYELWCDDHEEEAISRMFNAKVLIDETVEVDGIKIHGTPWSPWSFGRKHGFIKFAFCDDDNFIQYRWAHIPEGLDILVTHCPPGWCGLEEIVAKVRPKVHAFSHGDGKQYYARIKQINVEQYDRREKQIGKPVVMDI